MKVGGGSTTSTPEHCYENIPSGTARTEYSEDIFNSPSSSVQFDAFNKMHKKSKKKKEKDHEKRDKKRKHRKEKKKRYREESGQEGGKIYENEESVASPIHYFSSSIDDREEVNDNTDSSVGQLKKSEKTSLQRLLEYVHQLVERKDTQQFFAWPVTDQIAPGYSSVISRPMDLNSMKRNIENQVYSSLLQYIDDLQLMCRNAMIFNRADTIYYKAAKKLLRAALKLIAPDKLRSNPELLPLLSDLSSVQLGFVVDSSDTPSKDEENIKCHIESDNASTVEQNCKSDQMEDNATECKNEITSEDSNPDKIRAQAKNAAQQVASKLAQKKPAMEVKKNESMSSTPVTDLEKKLAAKLLKTEQELEELKDKTQFEISSKLGILHTGRRFKAENEQLKNTVKIMKKREAELYLGEFAAVCLKKTDFFSHEEWINLRRYCGVTRKQMAVVRTAMESVRRTRNKTAHPCDHKISQFDRGKIFHAAKLLNKVGLQDGKCLSDKCIQANGGKPIIQQTPLGPQ